jgi:hypothetical protein
VDFRSTGLLTPRVSTRFQPGCDPGLYTQIEEKAAPAWKRADIEYFSPDRLEAYPTLRRRLVAVGPRRCFQVHSNHHSTLRGAM